MGEVFVGSDAVAAGRLTRRELQEWYSPIFRGVYAPKGQDVSLRDRIAGATLASRDRTIIAGVAASALHGARWVDPGTPIEVVSHSRTQAGLVVRNESLAEDEVMWVGKVRVTTPARTAFDLGRYYPRDDAVARMDALSYATFLSPAKVALLIQRHRGARGLRALREALALTDGGAASPQETRLRLLFIDAGLPRPTTQIPVVERGGRLVRMLDMGWEEFMVGAEYDGEHHLIDRATYVKDMWVLPKVERLGWTVIRVIKETSDAEVVQRARAALISRGWRP